MADKRSAPTLTLNDIDKQKPAAVEIKKIGLSPEGLREVVLQLGKRTITVSEADSMADYRLSQAVSEISEKPLPERLAQGILLNLYPPLFACSTGDVPEPDQFFKMGKAAQELWIKTARKLNPHEDIDGVSWWTFLEEIEKRAEQREAGPEEEAKKKEQG